MNFYSGRYRLKWVKSFINLELIPKVDDMVIPKILLLTIKIMTPTIMNATKVVRENKMLKTTNSTIKGDAEKLIVRDFEV